MPHFGVGRLSNKLLLPSSKNVYFIIQNSPRNTPNHICCNVVFQQHRNLETCCDPVKSKVALITGPSNEIGCSIADHLLQADAKAVILADNNLKENKGAVTELSKKYGDTRAIFEPTDLTNKKDLIKLFKAAKQRFNNLDIVINNAAILDNQYRQHENEIVKKNVNDLLQATFLGFEEMFGKGGIILNTAAVLGKDPVYNVPILSSTNQFLIGFTRSLSHQYFYQNTNVKLMALCPSITDYKGDRHFFPKIDIDENNNVVPFPFYEPDGLGKSILRVLQQNLNGSVWYAQAGGDVVQLNNQQEIIYAHPMPEAGDFCSKAPITEPGMDNINVKLAGSCKKKKKKKKKKKRKCKSKRVKPCKKKKKKCPKKKKKKCKKKKKKKCKPRKKLPRRSINPGRGWVQKPDPCAKYKKKPDGLGKSILQVLQHNQNGSVWYTQAGDVYRINIQKDKFYAPSIPEAGDFENPLSITEPTLEGSDDTKMELAGCCRVKLKKCKKKRKKCRKKRKKLRKKLKKCKKKRKKCKKKRKKCKKKKKRCKKKKKKCKKKKKKCKKDKKCLKRLINPGPKC